MLERAVNWLRESGVDVRFEPVGARQHRRADGVLRVRSGGHRRSFLIERRERSPYPNELPTLFERHKGAAGEGLLLSAPYVSEGTARKLREAGWSWADDAGNLELRSQGFHLARRVSGRRPRQARTSRIPRRGRGLAIVRFLIGHGEQQLWSPSHLASIAGVSQPRASQVLAGLERDGLVDRVARGEWTVRRDELLDAFLTSYPGPGGSEVSAYSLDPPLATAVRLSAATSDGLAVSADVGPDLVVPLRRPTVLIVYAPRPVDLRALEVTAAPSSAEANVFLRTPADSSVFGHHEMVVTVEDHQLSLADPTQLIWELDQLGGEDRREAAGEMRAWLLNR